MSSAFMKFFILTTVPVSLALGGCEQSQRLGDLAGSTLEGILDGQLRSRGITTDYRFRNAMRGFLTDSIATLLEEGEQRRAADATTRVAGKPVGTSDGWTSETRPGVSGTSTVTETTKTADGTVCSTVRDVIIVNGQETIGEKKLCKPTGASGFSLAG